MLKKKLMGFAAAFAVAGLIVAAPMAANAEEVTTPDTSTTAPDQTTVETPSSSEPSESVDPPAASEEVTTPAEDTKPDGSADKPVDTSTTPDQTTPETPSIETAVPEEANQNEGRVEGTTDNSSPSPGKDVSVSVDFSDAYCTAGGGASADVVITVYPTTAGIKTYVRVGDDVTAGATGADGKYSASVNIAKDGITNVAAGIIRSSGSPYGGDHDYAFPDDCAVYVSPVGPTIDEPKQSVEIPEDPNFTYAVEGGSELQPGVHVLGPVGAGSIIATPKPGVSVSPDATTQWPFIFAVQPPKTVTPPALVPIGDHLPIPSADGVVYTGPGGTIVTGTVTLPDGQEQCFDAVPMGDIKITPGAVTHWCFTYQKPSTDNPGGNTGGPGTDTGAGTNGGSTGAGTATTGSGVANPVSNTAVSAERRASESTDTLALTGSSMPIGVPLGAAGAVLAGIVLMLARRSKQVI